MNQHKPQPHSTLESPMIIVENAFPPEFLLECLKSADHLPEEIARTGTNIVARALREINEEIITLLLFEKLLSVAAYRRIEDAVDGVGCTVFLVLCAHDAAREKRAT